VESEFNRQELLPSLGQASNYSSGNEPSYCVAHDNETDHLMMRCNDDEIRFKKNANTGDTTAKERAGPSRSCYDYSIIHT